MRLYDFGHGKWVFVDWTGIDPGYGTAWDGSKTAGGESLPCGIELKVHRPHIVPGWAIGPDLPWEKLGISPYASFVEYQGRFHCWYECYGREKDQGIRVNVAYAVSDDGIHWSRPELGVREYAGSRRNNLTDLRSHGACVFIDQTAPAEERFKTGGLHLVKPEKVAPGEKWWRQVGGLISPDGFRWQPLPEPVLPKNYCDTQTVIQYDDVLQKYVLFTRQKDGVMKRRGINRSESADFRSFPPSAPVFETSPLDPPDWDFQSPGYHKWPGAAHAHLMFPTVFHRMSDSMSIHLATSRDGIRWNRPMGREAFISPQDVDLDYKAACVHSCHGILSTAPGVWSLFLRPYRHGHNASKRNRSAEGLMRAVCREDGFVSLSSKCRGEFWTVPFVMASNSITLNVKCAYSGRLRAGVEQVIGDYNNMGSVRAETIEGYSLADVRPVKGDNISIALEWKGGGLAYLQGRTVRLRFQMYKTDLYAIRF